MLTKTWTTTADIFRQRAGLHIWFEGVCQGVLAQTQKDKHGNEIFVPIPHAVGGNREPPK